MGFIKKSNKNFLSVYLFLGSLFLIKIPPFYYLPIANKLFSSHTFAKLIIGFIFLKLFMKKTFLIKNKKTFLLIILFFISQSLSIINTLDIILFWKNYHNIISSLLIFLLSFLLIKPTRRTIEVLELFFTLSGIMIVFLELIFLITPTQTLNIFSHFIQQEVLNAYIVNFNRKRISLDLNIELFLPIFLSNELFYKNKIRTRSTFFFLISLMIFLLSIISNFRTRVTGSFFSILMMLTIFYFKRIKEDYKFEFRNYILNLIVIVLIFFITGNFALKLSKNMFRFNVIDRFLLEDRTNDRGGINYRIAAIEKSYEVFKAFPVTGIGLGNFIYFNSTPTGVKYSLVASKSEKNYYELVLYSPHNIFAQILSETGIMGIILFLILIVHFMVNDYRLLRHSERKYIYGYIIASWEIFIFMLFNPASTIFVNGWFWFLRGIIETFYFKK